MTRRTSIVIAVGFGLAVAVSSATAGGSDVEKLAAALFAKGAAVEELTRSVTRAERASLLALGVGLPRRGIAWYRVADAQQGFGYIARWQERGKHGAVELLVAASPDLAVAGVKVVKHRELWGAGIARKGFLKQFVGKVRADNWRIGGDVDALTSATISTRAVADGTRNVLHFLSIVAPQKTAGP